MKNKSIFVTGGAGYVGSVLVPKLLAEGHRVTVLDLMIYGDNTLDDHPNLNKQKGDIRDTELLRKIIPGHDSVIHLACISNDPSFELNPALGKSINLDAFSPLVEISKGASVKRFIYASSSSVYGIKEEKDVHEEMTLEPLTDYSNLAYHKREISVFGGSQLRPNIHIEDMADAYMVILDAPDEKISQKVFNVGCENHSVLELAKTVQEVVSRDVKLVVTPTDDLRSYHVSSAKIFKELGFATKHTIKQASIDLVQAFEKGLLPDSLEDERYFNIKKMQSIYLE
jgi:nucleoside-diphosphate-sugar epimerase